MKRENIVDIIAAILIATGMLLVITSIGQAFDGKPVLGILLMIVGVAKIVTNGPKDEE